MKKLSLSDFHRIVQRSGMLVRCVRRARHLQRCLCADAGRWERWNFADGTGRNIHPADLGATAVPTRWAFISQRDADEFVAPQYQKVQEALRKGAKAIGADVIAYRTAARDGSDTTTTEALAESGTKHADDVFTASVLESFAGVSLDEFESGAVLAYERLAGLFACGGGEEDFDFRGPAARAMVVKSLGQLLHEQRSQLVSQGLRARLHVAREDGADGKGAAAAKAQVLMVTPLLLELGTNGCKVAHAVDRLVGWASTRAADWLTMMIMLGEDRWAPRMGWLLARLSLPGGRQGGGGDEEELRPAVWRLHVHVALQVRERFELTHVATSEAVRPGRTRTMQLKAVLTKDEGEDVGLVHGRAPAPGLHEIIYGDEKQCESLKLEEQWRAEEEELATDAEGYATRVHFLEFEAPIDARAAAMRGPPDEIEFRLANLNGALMHANIMKDF